MLLSHKVNFNTRLRDLQCYVWSFLLCGCETWTVSKVMKDRLMAVKVWFLRRMLKISWTEKKSNKIFSEKNTLIRKAVVARRYLRQAKAIRHLASPSLLCQRFPYVHGSVGFSYDAGSAETADRFSNVAGRSGVIGPDPSSLRATSEVND